MGKGKIKNSELTATDLKSIAEFHRVVKNYKYLLKYLSIGEKK